MSIDLTADVLHTIILRAAGIPEQSAPADMFNRPFDDFGVDSLALLEILGTLKREFNIDIADSELPLLTSPQELLDHAHARVLADA